MACPTEDLNDGLLADCSVSTPVLGLKGGVIIFYDDIDWSATTITDSTITDLQLLSGKSGFPLKWVRRMGNSVNALVTSATERSGYTHSFLSQMAGFSAANSEKLRTLEHGKFLLVGESNYKGVDGKDAYKVFGVDAGLYLFTADVDFNANDGNILFTLSTLEGDKETYIYNSFLEGDSAVLSATAYESLFVQI